MMNVTCLVVENNSAIGSNQVEAGSPSRHIQVSWPAVWEKMEA